MFNFRNSRKKWDSLLQEINQINNSISILIDQNLKIFDEQAKLRLMIDSCISPKTNDTTEKSIYSSYEKGTFNTAKENFFDSPAEKLLEKYLNRICQKYDLGLNWGIRVLSHQPLINYVEMTAIKAVNNRNAFMHFDFLFEARKLKGNDRTGDKAGHFPLLAIELDGKTHYTDKQKERDNYKKGVCNKLNLHLIHIKYDEKDFTSEQLEAKYLDEIMTYLFVSIFDLSVKQTYISNTNVKELVKEKRNEILAKYPKNEFPELQECIDGAYSIFIMQNFH